MGACAGDGCPGATPMQGDFPEARRMRRPLKFRLTSQGASFLADNAIAILQGLFGGDDTGAVVLDLAELDMGLLDVEELGEGGVSLRELILALRVSPDQVTLELMEQPGRFRVRVDNAHISVRSGAIGFSEGGDDGVDLACRIADGVDDEDPARSRVGAITVELIVEPFVNEFDRIDARVDVPELTIHDWGVLFPVDCELVECTDGCGECRFGCPALSGSAAVAASLLENAKDRLAELIRSQIRERIDSTMEELGAQALDVELDVATLLGDLLPSAKAANPIRAMLSNTIGGIGVTRDPGGLGLDVRMDAGVDAQAHRCVTPLASEPEHVFGPPPGPEVSADPVHFVLSFAGGALDAAVWAAYKSGLLCVSLSSEEIAQISDGALALTAGGLESLLPGISSLAGPSAPLLVTLEPGFGAQDFPLVRVRQADDGRAQIVVALKKVGLSLHAEIDGRFARVIGLQATAEIHAGLVALPNASLEVTLDGVDIADLKVTYEEVLPGRDVSQLAGFLSGAVAGGLLADVSFPISAPGALGELLGAALELEVRSIRADGEQGDWIAARMALIQGQTSTAAASTEVEGWIGRTEVGHPPALAVPAAAADGHPLEYQVRVDHLPWTSFTQGGLPDLSGPHWMIHGEHSVHVRARRVGSPASLDMRGWQGFVTVPPPRQAPSQVPRQVAAHPGPADQSPDEPAAGCAQPGAPPLLLAPLLRRGGAVAGWTTLLTGCEDGKPAATSCDTSADCPPRQACSRGACVTAAPCATPLDCCPGQVCLTGLCQDPAACDAEHCTGAAQQCEGDWCVRKSCQADSACPAGLRCVDDRCVQGVPCDGKCTHGQACHALTAQCRPMPAACGGTSCGPGTLLHVSDPGGALLGGGCGWDDAACECVPSPPLPPGDIGRWGSVAWLDGKPVAAAYDSTYADLVWLEWPPPSASPATAPDPAPTAPARIESIAGVPLDQPRVGAQEGYRGGIAHPGPRTGRHTALVISAGMPLVAHRDDTGRALAVATRPAGAAWALHTVDDAGDAGHGIAAALLGDGMPALAYAATPSPGTYELRFIRSTTPTPTASADWGRAVPLPLPVPPPPGGGAPTPLTTEPALDMATRGDTTAIAWAADGRVGLASSTAGASFRASIVAETDAARDVAVAISADGAITVIFRDPGKGWLYAWTDGQLQTLDDGARAGTIRRMGAWPAAAYTGDNAGSTLLVAYQDPFEGDLWLARTASAAGPAPTPPIRIAQDGALGFHNALLLPSPADGHSPLDAPTYAYTALLGFDEAGRSKAGPHLIPIPAPDAAPR